MARVTMTTLPRSAAPPSYAALHAPWIAYLGPVLLALSLLLPWWKIGMVAPQYPQGLHVTTSFFAVTGDVGEVDELNHYIGFMPLAQVASFERKAAFFAAPITLALLVFAVRRRGAPAWLAALPALMLPLIFVGDLAFWLHYAGHHLDPHAPLSTSVAPWTPRLLGSGGVGQFRTYSGFGAGFYCAIAAALVTIYTLRNGGLRKR